MNDCERAISNVLSNFSCGKTVPKSMSSPTMMHSTPFSICAVTLITCASKAESRGIEMRAMPMAAIPEKSFLQKKPPINYSDSPVTVKLSILKFYALPKKQAIRNSAKILGKCDLSVDKLLGFDRFLKKFLHCRSGNILAASKSDIFIHDIFKIY